MNHRFKNKKEELIEALTENAKKHGFYGELKDEPKLPECDEITLRDKLRNMIMMRAPLEEMELTLQELESLTADLHELFLFAQKYPQPGLLERLQIHNEPKAKKRNKSKKSS